jgi:hypothetical protein
MRRSFLLLAAVGAAAVLVAGFASSAGAYGSGASHDTWQIGLSFNCNNPSYFMCQDPQTGLPQLGGFWGWVEFDLFADGTITGDAQLTGCGHTTGGGGPGSAGAGHENVDITSAHLGPAQPGDPTFGIPGRRCSRSTVQAIPASSANSGFPADPGHYSLHSVPGFSANIPLPSDLRGNCCSSIAFPGLHHQPGESVPGFTRGCGRLQAGGRWFEPGTTP